MTKVNIRPFSGARSTPTPGLINKLSSTLEPEQIAQILGIHVLEVVAAIKRSSRVDHWEGRCNRTGRKVVGLTERSTYIKAQIAGFADWDLIGVLPRNA